MKKLLFLLIVGFVSITSMSFAAPALSQKTVDAVSSKLELMMENEPAKFEMFVKKFYALLDVLPQKKLQQLLPLVENINSMVDRYNAKITAKKEVVPTISPEITAVTTKVSTGVLEKISSLVTYSNTGTSDIVILEFSDFECPFCRRHYTNGTLKDVIASFSGAVGKAYMHFPLSFHPLAEPTALAAECVKAQLGKDGYYSFIDKVFSTGSLTSSSVDAIVKGYSTLDTIKYTSCLSDKSTKDLLAKHITLAGSFEVRGTPANVVLNTKTGDYVLVSGAVPAEMIRDAVKQLMK